MTTGFVYHELYMWHENGNFAAFMPFGNPVQPYVHAETPGNQAAHTQPAGRQRHPEGPGPYRAAGGDERGDLPVPYPGILREDRGAERPVPVGNGVFHRHGSRQFRDQPAGRRRSHRGGRCGAGRQGGQRIRPGAPAGTPRPGRYGHGFLHIRQRGHCRHAPAGGA